MNITGNRRGSFAAYIDIEHEDFDECINDLFVNSDGKNYGWVIRDSFIERLVKDEPEAQRRFNEILYLKAIHGKGYFFFVDKANRHRPRMYKDLGLDIKASNLCSEIMLHSSPEYTFSCILSSINLMKWDEIKDDDTIFNSTVFLDCVTSDFLAKSAGIRGLEKVRKFTEKGRAIGLGVMGLHTHMQHNNIAFDSMAGMTTSNLIFKRLREESLRASQWMAQELGEPEWCKGYGVRNIHRTAQAPTKSTALLMGGVSEGINPQPAFVFTQSTPSGEVVRIDPSFLELLKEKGLYVNEDDLETKKLLSDFSGHKGSIQHRPEFTADEKAVFRTAFEINMYDHIDLVDYRQKFVCQAQSCNLFIANATGKDISKIYFYAYAKPNIVSLYYHTGLRDASIKTSFEPVCSVCE